MCSIKEGDEHMMLTYENSIEAKAHARKWLHDFIGHVVNDRGALSTRDLTRSEIINCGWAAMRADIIEAKEFFLDALDMQSLIAQLKKDAGMGVFDVIDSIEEEFLDCKVLFNELDEMLEDEYNKQYTRPLDHVEEEYFLDVQDRVRGINSTSQVSL